MDRVLIGIDAGSTVLKAAAFDAGTGRVLGLASERLALRVGSDGTREQSAAGLEAALARGLGRLRRMLGGRWRRVGGMGLAAQGGSTIIVDRETGRALTPLMLWNDTRAARHAARVRESAPRAFWRRLTWRDTPGAGLGKILWLKETRPAVMTERNLYAGVGEYLYFRLTGAWRQDACNALQIGCYNTARDRLDQRLMDFAGMPVSFVAPLRRGHETHPLSASASRRLGLAAGTPVAGPYMDHEAGYLSASGVSARPLQCSLGTAWVGNFVVAEGERWTSPVQLVLPAMAGRGHLVVQPLLTGNVTWDWALERFADRDMKTALRKAERIFAESLLPPEGLTAIPWLNVSNPLRGGVLGGAGFYGLNPGTRDADLLRATGVSLAYEMRRVFQEVAERGKADAVALGGGASRGAFFRTLLAELFAPLPVWAASDPDAAGCRGAVWVFSRAAGRAGVRRVARPGGDVRRRVAEGYRYYREVFERLHGDAEVGREIRFLGEARRKG